MKIPTWFRLTIEVPFFQVHTTMMHQAWARNLYMYYEIHVKIWKWKFDFEIGKKS